MTWRRSKLKFLAAEPIRNGVGEPAEFTDPSWPRYIRTTDIAGPRALRDETFASLPPATAALAPVLRDDILMSAAGSIGRTYLHATDDPACFAGYLVRFRPTAGIDPRFISLWTESTTFLDQVNAGAVRSTIDNFSASKYQNLVLDLPPLPQQRAIVDYVDAETTRIDDTVSALEQSIGRLSERRRSLIAGAVQGRLPMSLGGTVGLKPTRLKYLFSVRAGAWGDEPGEAAVDMACVRAADFDRLHLRVLPDKVPLRSFDVVTAQKSRLKLGDVVLEKSGGGAGQSVGGSALFELDLPAICSNFAARLRPYAGVVPGYLNYLLASLYWTGLTESLAKQTTGIANLDIGAYLSTNVEVPSTADQVIVADYLDKMTSGIDGVVGGRQRQVDLLLERRQALVTAAVTGLLEIPGAVA